MTGIPGVPKASNDLINYIIGLDQGNHVYAHCDICEKITEQVIVSYNQLPSMRKRELMRVMGRLLDITPLTRFAIGKAIFCLSCHTVRLSLGAMPDMASAYHARYCQRFVDGNTHYYRRRAPPWGLASKALK